MRRCDATRRSRLRTAAALLLLGRRIAAAFPERMDEDVTRSTGMLRNLRHWADAHTGMAYNRLANLVDRHGARPAGSSSLNASVRPNHSPRSALLWSLHGSLASGATRRDALAQIAYVLAQLQEEGFGVVAGASQSTAAVPTAATESRRAQGSV